MSSPDYVISTPENVDLHLELAGLGNRIMSCLIDTAISWALVAAIAIMALTALVSLDYLELPHQTKIAVTYGVIGSSVLFIFLVIFGYFIFFERLWNGQTPGKRLAHLRVVEQNGQPVSLSSVLIRNLVRVVDTGLLCIGLIVILIDKSERRLGDLAAGTLVIREHQPFQSKVRLTTATTHGFGPKGSQAQESAAAPESQAAPRHIDVGHLSPDEYELLSTYLLRRGKMTRSHRARLASQLEEYFRKKLKEPAAAESPEQFLETLYLAYGASAASNASATYDPIILENNQRFSTDT